MYKELEPARAKTKRPDDLWKDHEWWAEPKLDGWRFLMHYGRELPRVYLTGRRVSKRTGRFSEKGLCALPLWPHQDNITARDYTVIDGEVISPIGFHDIAGIMNVSPEKAAEKIKQVGPPKFVAFDLLFLDGHDLREQSYIQRRSLLNGELNAEYWKNNLVTLIPSWARPDNYTFYQEVIDSGGEGVILKNITGEYGEDWIKVKKYTTLDVIITGFKDAKEGKTGKFLGMIGGALVSVYMSNGELLEVGSVSGMTDAVRADMTANPNKWMNTVIEVAAQEFARERLRHPRFRCARPDANPKHATFQKMMADLGVPGYEKKGQLAFGF